MAPMVGQQPEPQGGTMPTPSTEGATGGTVNLKKAVDAIEAKVPEEDREGYDRVMLAVDRIMLAPETSEMTKGSAEEIANADDPAMAAAGEAATVLMAVAKKSKGKAKPDMLMMAAVPTAIHFLEFAEDRGLQITNDLLDETAVNASIAIAQAMGITEEQFMAAMNGQTPPEQPSAAPGMAPQQQGPSTMGQPTPSMGA